jgi:hypothetical protein
LRTATASRPAGADVGEVLSQEADVKVTNRDKRIWNIAGAVKLMPGINEVDEETWDKPEVSNSAADLVKAGLVVVDRKVSLKDLAALKPEEAISSVKETVDRALLEQWKATEKRPAVLQAIQAQIAAITPEKKAAEKPKDEDEEEAPAHRRR